MELTQALVLVLILPIYKTWQLQMSTARKILIMFLFLLGGLVSVVGIIRIHYLTEVYDILGVGLELVDTTCMQPHNWSSEGVWLQNADTILRDLFTSLLLANH